MRSGAAAAAVSLLAFALAAPHASSPKPHASSLKPQASSPKPSPQAASLIKSAFDAVYSLDFQEGLALARQSVTVAPSDPSTHRAVASMVWLNLLFLRGAVVTDQYLSGRLTQQLSIAKPPAEMDAEFKRELAQAIDLAGAQLKRDARNVDAQFNLGAAYGLQASYAASVEGSVLSGFRLARRAFDATEWVLEHAPDRVEAGLVAGTYRYIVSVLSLPARMLAYVAGFGGGKERGIALIEGAMKSPETHVDARVALLLIYAREGRHVDALRIAGELEREFPRNRLFTLEAGSAAIRAGRAAEGEATISRGLAALERDPRPKFPGERAFWLYKRAVARIAENHPAEARADLDLALQNAPVDWTRGRIHLQLGKVADLTSRRTDAINEYRLAKATCATRNDPVCADEADRLMKRPFRY
jgi:tetratricopeptide (TPR) repeat protein